MSWRLAALKNGFQEDAAYRVEFFLSIFSSALVPAAIQIILWYAIFQLGGQTQVAGWGYAQLIQYTLVSTLFTQVRGGDHDFDLQEMIRTGSLSNYLLKPISAVEFVYLRGVGGRLFVALVCLCIGTLAFAAFGFSIPRLWGAMLLAIAGNVIHYQIGAVLATAAFLWEEAYSLLMVKNMLVQLLSGELIPLNLFPVASQWIWKSTPFYLYVYGPTQYALGHWTHSEYLHGLGMAIAWMMGLSVLIRLSWGWGIRKYSSLGG